MGEDLCNQRVATYHVRMQNGGDIYILLLYLIFALGADSTVSLSHSIGVSDGSEIAGEELVGDDVVGHENNPDKSKRDEVGKQHRFGVTTINCFVSCPRHALNNIPYDRGARNCNRVQLSRRYEAPRTRLRGTRRTTPCGTYNKTSHCSLW